MTRTLPCGCKAAARVGKRRWLFAAMYLCAAHAITVPGAAGVMALFKDAFPASEVPA